MRRGKRDVRWSGIGWRWRNFWSRTAGRRSLLTSWRASFASFWPSRPTNCPCSASPGTFPLHRWTTTRSLRGYRICPSTVCRVTKKVSPAYAEQTSNRLKPAYVFGQPRIMSILLSSDHRHHHRRRHNRAFITWHKNVGDTLNLRPT